MRCYKETAIPVSHVHSKEQVLETLNNARQAIAEAEHYILNDAPAAWRVADALYLVRARMAEALYLVRAARFMVYKIGTPVAHD